MKKMQCLSFQNNLYNIKRKNCVTIRNEQRKQVQNKSILSKNRKISGAHSPGSEQNEHIAGHIHSTQNKKKHTAKQDWEKFVLKQCQLKLRICSSTYGLNISALIFLYEVIFACCIAKKQPPEVFWKKGVLKLYKFHRKASVLESLFNKGLKAYNFIKKRLQHKCFPAKFAKPLKTLIFENIYITCNAP